MEYYIVIFAVVILSSWGAPNKKRPEAGPCVGMDCLHGVLMHGDEEMGEDHSKEDLYKRLEKEDAERTSRKPVGPCHGQDCMELINHGPEDTETAHKMSQKIGPENNERATVDLSKALHAGQKVDHHAPKKPTEAKQSREPVVADPEALLRGGETPNRSASVNESAARGNEVVEKNELRSGKENAGVSDSTSAREAKHDKEGGPGDVEAVLHGDERVRHAAPGDKTTTVGNGKEARAADIEVALHGVDGVDHSAVAKHSESHDDKEAGVMDAERLLHGGEHVNHGARRAHGHHPQKRTHHGGHRDDLDPHVKLHAEYPLDDGSLSEDEVADYKKWKNSQQKDEEDGVDSLLGFSFPHISDTILNEIEFLKRRYLPRFWSDEDENEDDDNDVQVEEDEAEVSQKGRSDDQLKKGGKTESKDKAEKDIKLIAQDKHLPREVEKKTPEAKPYRDRVEI